MTQTALPARIAVSTVIFSLRRPAEEERHAVVLPLVRRTRDPHHGQWALPGGWLDVNDFKVLDEVTNAGEKLPFSPNRERSAIEYQLVLAPDLVHVHQRARRVGGAGGGRLPRRPRGRLRRLLEVGPGLDRDQGLM